MVLTSIIDLDINDKVYILIFLIINKNEEAGFVKKKVIN